MDWGTCRGAKVVFPRNRTWLAVKLRVDKDGERFDPTLLKRNTITFQDPDDFVEFATLKEIYDGFVASISELHRHVLEQIRIAEEEFAESPAQSA
jgi:hypothetical protein